MTTESGPETEGHLLEIAFDSGRMPVSNVSSLLRVVQAALREVARSGDETRDAFSQRPQPVLQMSARSSNGELILRFGFTDPSDSTPMTYLSERTFTGLVDQLAEFIKMLPQKGLWGHSVSGARRRDYDSEVARRMDELRMQLRRFPRVSVTYHRRRILIEGDRVEII